MRLRIDLAYDGTGFHGWAAQPGLRTVQGEVEQALAICGGDAIAALRATLIANAFLERRVELLLAGQSAGYARGRVKKPSAKKDEG